VVARGLIVVPPEYRSGGRQKGPDYPMKAIYLLGVAGGVGLGLILACLMVEWGVFPVSAGRLPGAVLYGGAALGLGTAIGAGIYHKRHIASKQ
jgi:hypothetical protein